MFNPNEWLPKETCTPQKFVGKRQYSGNSNFDAVLQQIERRGIDITAGYENWRNLGFAFASEFGEGGRGYFHRVSQFFSGYKSAETDKQYTRCLRGKQGISIKTFYYLAKNSGIKI